MPVPRAFGDLCKRLQILVRGNSNVSALNCLCKLLFPTCGLSPNTLVNGVDHHRLSDRVDHVFSQSIDIDERLPGAVPCNMLGMG